MTTPTFRRSSRAAIAACLCLCGATVAFAGKLTVYHMLIDLPGVDHYGNLDLGHLSPVPFKIVVNTKANRVVALGRGHVHNQSGKLQVFKNQATMNQGLIDYPYVTLKRDLFVVAKSGRCRATAVGTLID